MGLSNAAKRARNYSQTVNQNQGGGDKKAGFPYQIGRSSWSTIALGSGSSVAGLGRCANLKCMQAVWYKGVVRQSRPISTSVRTMYFRGGKR